MKYILSSIFIFLLHIKLFAQESTIKLTELSVPNAPAFLLLDAAPTTIESPVNPKEFAFGLVQNFSLDSKWLQNYSMEFTPYWWCKPAGRSAYSFMGLKKEKDKVTYKQNYFSGLQFTSISVAFLIKDMIPDSINSNQKIGSVGGRTTVIRIRSSSYEKDLNEKLNHWHSVVQPELDNMNNAIIANPEKADSIVAATLKLKSKRSQITDEIKELMEQKPVFNWDIACAFSQYGVGDSVWKSGRSGIWTTLSSFIPLDKSKHHQHYLDLLVTARYLSDHYVKSDDGNVGSSNTFDFGGKAGVEIYKFSIAVETMLRKVSVNKDWRQRITGVLNYRVKDDLFLVGTYGTDFGPGKKIIALFGVNLGFGNEKVSMPDLQ